MGDVPLIAVRALVDPQVFRSAIPPMSSPLGPAVHRALGFLLGVSPLSAKDRLIVWSEGKPVAVFHGLEKKWPWQNSHSTKAALSTFTDHQHTEESRVLGAVRVGKVRVEGASWSGVPQRVGDGKVTILSDLL